MTHAGNKYITLSIQMPAHLEPGDAEILRSEIAAQMAQISQTPFEDNLALAREVIVRAYAAGMRVCQIGLRVGAVH